MNRPPKTIIATREEVHDLMKEKFKPKNPMLAFYTSHFDRIIKDEDLFVLPMYDRQIQRAHSIFDTVHIIDNRLVLLDEHLDRMVASCKLCSIDLPMPLSVIKEKIIDLAAFCVSFYNLENQGFGMRYWVSSGGDTFGILPSGTSKFYALAFRSDNIPESTLYKEVTIDEIEPKTGVLALAKTTNYLLNSLVAMEAKKKGGYFGLMVNKDGIVLEGSIVNVGFIWRNGDFVTSSFDKVLKGITLIESMSFIKDELIPKGIVKNIVQKDFTLQDVYENAVEMIFFGGNKILPVGSLNNVEISKEIGQITKILQENVVKRAWDRAEQVPLDRYKENCPSSEKIKDKN